MVTELIEELNSSLSSFTATEQVEYLLLQGLRRAIRLQKYLNAANGHGKPL